MDFASASNRMLKGYRSTYVFDRIRRNVGMRNVCVGRCHLGATYVELQEVGVNVIGPALLNKRNVFPSVSPAGLRGLFAGRL